MNSCDAIDWMCVWVCASKSVSECVCVFISKSTAISGSLFVFHIRIETLCNFICCHNHCCCGFFLPQKHSFSNAYMLKLGFAIARLGSAVSRFFQGFKDEKKKKMKRIKKRLLLRQTEQKLNEKKEKMAGQWTKWHKCTKKKKPRKTTHRIELVSVGKGKKPGVHTI